MWTKTATLVIASLVAMIAAASGAPQQLQNKTITVSWSVESTMVAPSGKVFTPIVHQERLMYVSSTGRIFVKSTISSPGGTRSAEMAPGEQTPAGGARDVRIEGNKIVAMAALNDGGAGRIVISFDQGYSTCTLDVTIGRSGNGPQMRRAPNGVPVEVTSQRVSGQTCSVREGNAFANQ